MSLLSADCPVYVKLRIVCVKLRENRFTVAREDRSTSRVSLWRTISVGTFQFPPRVHWRLFPSGPRQSSFNASVLCQEMICRFRTSYVDNPADIPILWYIHKTLSSLNSLVFFLHLSFFPLSSVMRGYVRFLFFKARGYVIIISLPMRHNILRKNLFMMSFTHSKGNN